MVLSPALDVEAPPYRAAHADVRRLLPVQPRTMVEQAAEAIVSAAARGVFLPGDRLVEAEIARDLGISRVPVREALRLLESQGIVVSTPYKGMRLMQVTNRSAAGLMRVRLGLESLALREIVSHRAPGAMAMVSAAADRFREAAANGDPGLLIAADQAFHAELCRASGNESLSAVWQSLAGQLAVIWSLAHAQRGATVLVDDHDAVVAALEAGDAAAAEQALADHLGHHFDFDFEAALERRRAERARR